jgi:ribosome-binding protein aMBF1 (putative translation factor)
MRAHTKKRNTEKEVSTESSETSLIDWQSAFGDLIEKFSEAGATLRGFRLREGWTQTKLAEKIDIGQANLSKMEHGKRPIGKQIAKRLASLFKTDYRIFL